CSAGAPASLVLMAPNGGETWPIRSEQTVSWTKGSGVGAVDVEVSRDGGIHWETIATDRVGTQVTWTVTPPTSAPASVRVRDAGFFARSDPSAGAGERARHPRGVLRPPRREQCAVRDRAADGGGRRSGDDVVRAHRRGAI